MYIEGEITLISTKFKGLSKRHLQDNFLLYFILLISFVIGIVIGAILINRLNPEDKLGISSYLSMVVELMSSNGNKTIDIFKSSLFTNFRIALIIWGLGFFLIGIIIIPIIIGWKGIAIGFTVGFMVKEFGIKGFIFSLTSLLPHYLIILPGFITIGAISASNSINRKKSHGKIAYKRNFVDYNTIFFIFFLLIVIGSLIEGFFIPYILNLIGLSL